MTDNYSVVDFHITFLGNYHLFNGKGTVAERQGSIALFNFRNLLEEINSMEKVLLWERQHSIALFNTRNLLEKKVPLAVAKVLESSFKVGAPNISAMP